MNSVNNEVCVFNLTPVTKIFDNYSQMRSR